MNDTALRHVGILGMKWGRRKSSPSADHVKANSIKKKKLNEMSNDEIRALNTRMQLESQYKNLTPKKVNVGKKILGATLGSFGKQVLSGVVVAAASAGTAYVVKNAKDYYPVMKSLVLSRI